MHKKLAKDKIKSEKKWLKLSSDDNKLSAHWTMRLMIITKLV